MRLSLCRRLGVYFLATVSACTIEDLLKTIEENVSGGAVVEKDEFIEMVRILPTLRGGEPFRSMEETLERIYRSFEAANRVDLYLVRLRCFLSDRLVNCSA